MSRVVVLGLDAADPALLRRWAACGVLPAIGGLLAEATAVPMENPPGLFVGAVWPSLFTGTSPTRHGRYCYEELVPGTYAVRGRATADSRVEPFWAALSRAGRRVAVVDVPKSPCVAGAAEVQILDWGTHDPTAEGFRALPASTEDDVRGRYGCEPVGICDEYTHDLAGVRTLRDRLLARIEAKTRMCLELLERAPWDLFVAVLAEAHCAGHQFWRIHDPSHPRHDPAIRGALGDPLESVYRGLDAAVARVRAALDPETTLLVVASHGMAAHYDGSLLLADMLSAMEGTAARRRTVNVLQRAWHGLPGTLRKHAAPLAAGAGRWLARRRAGGPPGLGSALRAPQPAATRFFAMPNNDSHGAIRLNLVGREPAGRVHPGAEEAVVVAELVAGLGSFVNEETGRPAVVAVHRLAELYPGEPVDGLPDLIVDWDRSAPIRRLRSPRFGRLARESPSPRSGDHRPSGLLLARGPGIAAGRELAPVRSVDVAATVSHLLGVERPDLDGHPIPGIAHAHREA